MSDEIDANLRVLDEALAAVETAIRDYHFALDTRQHGGQAAHLALQAIMAALDMPWVMHAELRRRERKPS